MSCDQEEEEDCCAGCGKQDCVCDEEKLPVGVIRTGRTLTYTSQYWEAWSTELNTRLWG